MSQNPSQNGSTDLEQVRPGPYLPTQAEPDDPNLRISEKTRRAIEAGIPKSTKRAYETNFKDFAAWCATEGRDPLPATPQTLAEYTTYLTEHPRKDTGRPYSPTSIERVLAAIRTWHKAAGWNPPETKGARKVLAGYRERLAEAHDPRATPRKADPAVPTRLRLMLGTLDRSTFAGKRDAALLLLGYACAARVSELSALDTTSVTKTEKGLEVNVWRRKTKKWQDVAVPYGARPETCPVRATWALLQALAELDRLGGPLFVRVDRHGRIAPPMMRKGKPIGEPDGRMTPEAIADVVERIGTEVDEATLPPEDLAARRGRWKGHSLRRGFVNGSREAKHDTVTIGRHGGWADGSKALLGYIDDVDKWENNPLYDAGL